MLGVVFDDSGMCDLCANNLRRAEQAVADAERDLKKARKYLENARPRA